MRDGVSLLVAWLGALAVAAAVLAATGYRTRDPDSRAYIAISARLADEPVARWIAPQWWGAWAAQGLFREHPAGTFVVPAFLTRAGYPAAQSLFVVTLAAQIVSLLLIAALASRLLPAAAARGLVWILLLIPIAFVFRVRANQEYLLLAGLLLAVYGLERARDGWRWVALALAGALYALLVKGVFALLAPVIAALWLWTRRARGASDSRSWMGLAAMVLMMPVVGWVYEQLYVATTGQSFLDYYLGSRMTLEGSVTTLPFPLDKGWNALWYLGRVVWYSAPWSLLLPLAAWPLPSVPGTSTSTVPGTSSSRDWVRFAALAALATILLVAARDTKADRYVFPAYFFAAAAGGIVAWRRWRTLATAADRLDATWPWGPALLWLVLVVGRVFI